MPPNFVKEGLKHILGGVREIKLPKLLVKDVRHGKLEVREFESKGMSLQLSFKGENDILGWCVPCRRSRG
jgi:hypothetical protein